MILRWVRNMAIGLVLTGLGLSLSVPMWAEPPASGSAGFHRIQLLGNSDTFVSLPFARPAAASGLVAAVADNTVTLTGIPSWTTNQFVYAAGVQTNTYYLLIASGALEGIRAPITSNAVDSVTLNLTGISLAGLATGDRVMVVPYWTFGSVFPGGAAVHTSSNRFIRKTEVFIPNLTGPGINLSASKTYYFMSSHWYEFGSTNTAIRDNDVFSPTAYFIVRHNVPTNTTLTVSGTVVPSKWAVSLRTSNTPHGEDNMVALPRPAPVSLDDSGLIASGAFSSSPSRFVRTDELYTFDNTRTGFNKSASATYFHSGGKWLMYPYTTNVGTNLVLTPGTGVIIRKAASTNTPTWTNAPNY